MTSPHCTEHRSAGLTLIELVVVMAIFALVAVMGVQSLTTTLRVSERLRAIDGVTLEMGSTISLLRNDMTSVVPMLFYPPNRAPRAAVWQSEDKMTFGFSLAGQPTFDEVVTDRHYVEWHFDKVSGQLLRRHWPSLLPAHDNQLGDDLVVLGDLAGFELRTWWEGTGWVEGVTQPVVAGITLAEVPLDQDSVGAPAAAYYSNLPSAVEITLKSKQSGDIRILQTLQ